MTEGGILVFNEEGATVEALSNPVAVVGAGSINIASGAVLVVTDGIQFFIGVVVATGAGLVSIPTQLGASGILTLVVNVIVIQSGFASLAADGAVAVLGAGGINPAVAEGHVASLAADGAVAILGAGSVNPIVAESHVAGLAADGAVAVLSARSVNPAVAQSSLTGLAADGAVAVLGAGGINPAVAEGHVASLAADGAVAILGAGSVNPIVAESHVAGLAADGAVAVLSARSVNPAVAQSSLTGLAADGAVAVLGAGGINPLVTQSRDQNDGAVTAQLASLVSIPAILGAGGILSIERVQLMCVGISGNYSSSSQNIAAVEAGNLSSVAVSDTGGSQIFLGNTMVMSLGICIHVGVLINVGIAAGSTGVEGVALVDAGGSNNSLLVAVTQSGQLNVGAVIAARAGLVSIPADLGAGGSLSIMVDVVVAQSLANLLQNIAAIHADVGLDNGSGAGSVDDLNGALTVVVLNSGQNDGLSAQLLAAAAVNNDIVGAVLGAGGIDSVLLNGIVGSVAGSGNSNSISAQLFVAIIAVLNLIVGTGTLAGSANHVLDGDLAGLVAVGISVISHVGIATATGVGGVAAVDAVRIGYISLVRVTGSLELSVGGVIANSAILVCFPADLGAGGSLGFNRNLAVTIGQHQVHGILQATGIANINIVAVLGAGRFDGAQVLTGASCRIALAAFGNINRETGNDEVSHHGDNQHDSQQLGKSRLHFDLLNYSLFPFHQLIRSVTPFRLALDDMPQSQPLHLLRPKKAAYPEKRTPPLLAFYTRSLP